MYVCIWGPGKDGKTFMVELCSASDRLYKATYGTTVKDFTGKTYFAVEVT